MQAFAKGHASELGFYTHDGNYHATVLSEEKRQNFTKHSSPIWNTASRYAAMRICRLSSLRSLMQ